VESSLSTGEERKQEQEKNAGEADKTSHQLSFYLSF
jgi:hypothetical protein